MPKTHGRRWRGASAAPPPFAAMRGSKCVAHCLGPHHRGHVRPHACRPLPWPPATAVMSGPLRAALCLGHAPPLSLRPCAAPVTMAMRHPRHRGHAPPLPPSRTVTPGHPASAPIGQRVERSCLCLQAPASRRAPHGTAAARARPPTCYARTYVGSPPQFFL